jgi:hypothetical protein
MLVGGILGAVVLAGLAVAMLTRRRSLDDEHSVEGYHRQLHTLEHISVHPVAGAEGAGSAGAGSAGAGSAGVAGVADAGGAGAGADAGAAGAGAAAATEAGAAGAAVRHVYPESAVRLAGTTTPRVPERPPPAIPPPVIPSSTAGSTPAINSTTSPKVTFDDARATPPVAPTQPAAPTSGLFRRQDRAMNAMNRRPRRLAAPALAVASVTVLIVVLLLAGSHKVPPARVGSGQTHGQGHHQSTSTSRGPSTTKKHTQVTTTTTLPVVSLPTATSTHAANYKVATSAFTLVVSATTGPCWINVMNPSSNATVFSGVLAAGEQRSLPVTGPVSLEVGAPSVFAGTVNGKAFVLPYGYQTPFTLNFVPVGSPST